MYSYFVLICTVYGDLHKHAAGWSGPRVSQKLSSRRAMAHSEYSASFSRNLDPFPAAYMAPFDLRALWTHERQLTVPFLLSIHLPPVKIMGNLNLNENFKSG